MTMDERDLEGSYIRERDETLSSYGEREEKEKYVFFQMWPIQT